SRLPFRRIALSESESPFALKRASPFGFPPLLASDVFPCFLLAEASVLFDPGMAVEGETGGGQENAQLGGGDTVPGYIGIYAPIGAGGGGGYQGSDPHAGNQG